MANVREPQHSAETRKSIPNEYSKRTEKHEMKRDAPSSNTIEKARGPSRILPRATCYDQAKVTGAHG